MRIRVVRLEGHRARAPGRLPVLYLLPFFAAYLLFWAVPLTGGIRLSTYSNALFGAPVFVGLSHYVALAGDRRFLHALLNTLGYGAATVGLVVPLGLGLALLLSRALPRARAFFRFCLLLPGLTPPAVLGMLFLLVFSGPHGLLNSLILAPFGSPELDWLKDPPYIRFALVLQAVWRWTGFATLFLLAGLDGIPRAYYDACLVEGAGPIQTLRYVILPLLRPILAFCSLLLAFDAFVLFAGAYVLLGGAGGTADAGLLLITYVYQTAFTFGRFGSAAAMSYATIPLLALFVWLFLAATRRGDRAARERIFSEEEDRCSTARPGARA